MKALILTSALLSTTAFAQQLVSVTELCPDVEETSGLLYLDNRIITLNDALNDETLYEIESSTGMVTRSVDIMKSENIDWESLSADAGFIYICDIGNDEGLRNSFKIYRVSIADYLTYTLVDHNVIEFEYPFLNSNGLEFNAESSVVMNNYIYLFTKEAANESTQVFRIPKTPGFHTAEHVTSIDVQASITDATITEDGLILLTGLDSNNDFIVTKLTESSGTFTIVDQEIFTVPASYSGQIEGICPINDVEFYVSSELSSSGSSGLFTLDIGSSASIEAQEFTFGVHPNPADNFVKIETEEPAHATVHSVSGAKIWEGELLPGETKIETAQWNSGVYVISLAGENTTSSQKLVVK